MKKRVCTLLNSQTPPHQFQVMRAVWINTSLMLRDCGPNSSRFQWTKMTRSRVGCWVVPVTMHTMALHSSGTFILQLCMCTHQAYWRLWLGRAAHQQFSVIISRYSPELYLFHLCLIRLRPGRPQQVIYTVCHRAWEFGNCLFICSTPLWKHLHFLQSFI